MNLTHARSERSIYHEHIPHSRCGPELPQVVYCRMLSYNFPPHSVSNGKNRLFIDNPGTGDSLNSRGLAHIKLSIPHRHGNIQFSYDALILRSNFPYDYSHIYTLQIWSDSQYGHNIVCPL